MYGVACDSVMSHEADEWFSISGLYFGGEVERDRVKLSYTTGNRAGYGDHVNSHIG